jgi:lipoprotein NlpI
VRIAEGFVAEMERGLGAQRQRAASDLSELQRDLGIDDAFMTQVYASRGQYCYLAATLTFDPSARLARGEQYLEQALALAPEVPDLHCSLAILLALKGDAAASLRQWRRAFALDPGVAERRASHPYVRQILKRNGIQDLPERLRSEAG